jgi:DNA-binding HxlR family transcriptional regulator
MIDEDSRIFRLIWELLVVGKNFGEVLPIVEYSPTEKGKRIKPLIDEMVTFVKLYEK